MFLEISGRSLITLELGQIYLLGRQIDDDKKKSGNFIELYDGANISEKHCVIETNQKEAFVFDLYSVKGTLLNNQIVSCMKKTLLKNGDILKIGDREIKYIHQEHEMSYDSSGFLDVQKSSSDALASSPESQAQDRLKERVDHKFLMPDLPSSSFSSRRSDSFAIPETQYCQRRNSLNNSKLSIAESDKSNGKINFIFGDQDSFEDDDLCIPETQELAVDGICSEVVQHKAKQSTLLNEDSSTLTNANISNESQFRICTQDYNEGFGEEQTVDDLHSQIIPIIKHSPFTLNKTNNSSKANSLNHSNLDRTDKEMSSLKWPNSNTDQETTALRADCLTPDIFDFEVNENADDKACKKESHNMPDVDEDEEDLLPTQCLPSVLKKVEQKMLNVVEKPCLEKENEEVLTLSDKENMCPAIPAPVTALPPTQIFEARSHTSIPRSNSISSAIKVNTLQENENSPNTLLNIDPDEEDDLLTQAFLQPTTASAKSLSFSNKNLPIKCFNSTLLDDKCTEKAATAFFAEVEKNQFKQVPTNVLKKPDKDVGNFTKTTSATASTTSENDIELLMCTPQLIADNMSLGKSEELRKHILAVKNRHLFGDDTEDEDDEQNNLVKLINVPKNSLDFDQLLAHLNQKSETETEKHDEQKEAQKIYKFNISFGREQEEKQANSSTSRSKSSAYSRDERHAARDKEREISERKRKTKTNQDSNKTTTKRLEKNLEKEVEARDKEKKKVKVEKEMERKLKESERKPNLKTNKIDKMEKIQRNDQNLQDAKVKEDASNKSENTTRLRKRQTTVKNEKQEELQSANKQQPTPAKRLTRSKSRVWETSSSSNIECKDDDMDSISTQPYVKLTRYRIKSKQNNSQDSTASATSTITNELQQNKIQQNQSPNINTAAKKSERKRKAEPAAAATAVAAAVPAKVERKRLRSVQYQESLTPAVSSIAISITNVDSEMIKDLLKNAKDLWNIAPNAADCDILVMDKPLRTFKFLLAMARGIPIVTSEYLKKLNKSKYANEVNLKDYHFADSGFERKYKFSLIKSLQAAKQQKIFKNYEFLMTGSILPIPQEIKVIIEKSGGCVHNKTPEPKENQKLYLVTAKEDKKDWHKYRRLNKNIAIVSTEAIMSAIMSQSVERMNNYVLA